MSAALRVEGLTVAPRGCGEAKVRDLRFQMEAGRSLILLGESGCGKSLTCRAIAGILDARRFDGSGEIGFGGEAVPASAEARPRGAVALIIQNPMTALNPSVRVGRQMAETIRLHRPFRRAEARTRCARALAEAGLGDPGRVMRAHPFALSGGMLQRVMIAIALAIEARVVVADEPTTALDAAHRREVVDAVLRLRDRGAAVLFVTHDFAVARRIGGEMMIMKDGAIVERGTADEILRAPKAEYTRALVAASRLRRAQEGGAPDAGGD